MQGRLYTDHNLPLDRRSRYIFRSTELLPTNPWQGPILLQVRLPTQDSPMELGRDHLAELLPECSLWSKLEL